LIKSLKLWEHVLSALRHNVRKLSPGGVLGLSFVFGLYLVDLIPITLIFLIVLGLACCVAVSLRQYKWERFVVWLIISGLLGGVGYRYTQTWKALQNFRDFQELLQVLEAKNRVLWTGYISSFVDKYPDKIKFTARVEKILDENSSQELFDAQKHKSKLKLYVYVKNSGREWKYGERFIARSSIQEFKKFKNPSPPSYQDFQKLQLWKGVYGSSFVNDDQEITVLESPHSFFVRFLQWMDGRRQAFSDYLDRVVPYPESAFLKALTVGYRGFIDGELNEFTNRAGVQHLLAISGLHLASVAVLLFFLVRQILRVIAPRMFLFMPEPILSALLALPAVGCYAIMTGLAAPTQRAFLAVCFLTVGLLMFRRIDFFTIFFLSAAIILLADLSFLYSPSFVLSFAAVAGIAWVAMVLRPAGECGHFWAAEPKPDRHWSVTILFRAGRAFFDVFWISLCVQMVLCPLVIYFFFRFCWAGLMANVVLVPYVSFVVLPVSLATLAGFLIDPLLSNLFVGIAKPLITGMIWLIKFFGNWNGLVFWGTPWTLSPVIAKLWIILYWVVLAIVVVILKRKRLTIFLTMIVLILVAIFYQSLIAITERGASQTLEAVMLDVGDGSSTFIAFPHGGTMIIDGGGIPRSSFDVGARIIVPAIIASGFRHIDDVVLSHYHYDHAKGLEFLLNSFPVKRFVEPLCPPEDKGFSLTRFATSRRLVVISYRQAESLGNILGDVNFRILHPPFDANPVVLCRDLNESSTVFKIGYGETVIVIPSDAPLNILQRVKPNIVRRANELLLLVAPHHGRCGAFNSQLFDEIAPDVVVISAKKTRSVPCPALLRWCKEKKVPCFTTFDNGAIKAISTGKSWQLYGTDEKGAFYPLISLYR